MALYAFVHKAEQFGDQRLLSRLYSHRVTVCFAFVVTVDCEVKYTCILHGESLQIPEFACRYDR